LRLKRHKQVDSDRRKLPRSERLIIAMTLVVGVAWLVSSVGWVSWWLPQTQFRIGRGTVFLIHLSMPSHADTGVDAGLHDWSVLQFWPRMLPEVERNKVFAAVAVPLWPILLVFASVLFLPSALRTSHRRRRNRCVACGYAQDEALERCPECGRLASEPSIGFWLLAWRAYRWPLVCIAINVGVTLVAIAVLN